MSSKELDGTTYVETYNLNDLSDKDSYQNVLNCYDVIRDEFMYDKFNNPLITVWYVKDDEEDILEM